jgi:hypothetical protein
MSFFFVLPVLGIPLSALAVSYGLLVREFGTWRLWNVKIHESGRWTLGETVFYYNHFLRELPVDTLYAIAVVNSYRAAGITVWEQPLARIAAQLALALLLVWVVAGSVRRVGVRWALADFLQFRETDARHGWGTHWQMHFLSTAATLLLLLLPAALLEPTAPFLTRAGPLVAVFIALSVLFKTGLKAVSNTRWILHGARELFTYGLMTALPLLVPLLTSEVITRLQARPVGIGMIAIVCLLAAYMLVVRRRSDLGAEASSPRGAAFLLSSHFFEHVLDYAYIFLLVLLLMAWAAP